MKFFETEYNIDLLEIDKRLEKEKDRSIILMLLKDKKYILSSLGTETSQEYFIYNKKLNEEEINNFLKLNPLEDVKINSIKFYTTNIKKIEQLTKKFIEKSEFQLFATYKKIIEYGGLKLLDAKTRYSGFTIYLKSLDKNYILVKKNNSVSDYSTLIHELGHARANHLCKDSSHQFGETYSIFLELVFAEWLSKNGFIKDGYNLKISLLTQIKKFFFESIDELSSYVYSGVENSFNNYIFEYKYNVLKDIILAFYLYDLYLTNPEELLIKIDYFILNSNKISKEELLKIFDMDNSLFYNKDKTKEKLLSSIENEKKMITGIVRRIVKK